MPTSTKGGKVSLHPEFEASIRDVVNEATGGGFITSGGDGSGSGSSGLEARIAKLEATTQHIQSDITEIKQDVRDLGKTQGTDFRILFGALIFTALGLAALMAKGFDWI